MTWSDVRGLLVKVISNAFHLSDTPTGIFAQNQLNTLSAIFQGLEKEVKDKESRETINLLISVFSGSSSNKKQLESDTDKSKRIRPADNVPLQSIDQLKTFVIDNFVPRDTLEKIIQIDRCEELSILMQLLQFSQESTVEDRIIQNLRDILTTELNNREIRTLISALMFMASQNDSGRFYETMRFLTILFRSRKKFSSQEFLVTICQKVSPAAQTLVWPILVNEILACGRNDHQTVFNQLVLIAATLSLREMKDRWPELEAMDCFQEKRIASEIFNPQLKNTFHLFSFLLETSLKRQISARILSGILASPPDWLIEAVAPMLQLTIPQHVKFLQIYLLAAHKDYFSINLRVAAGTLVVNHLPDISEQQMNEAWVVKTLEATPELQVEETRPLLELILAEKRMLVLPKWPNACRRAATEALKKLRRKPL